MIGLLNGWMSGGADVMASRSGMLVMLVSGALILGSIGATAGSWYGSRDPAPLPSDVDARTIAAEILPDHTPTEVTRRDFDDGYGIGGTDELEAGNVSLYYQGRRPAADSSQDSGPPDCELARTARAHTARSGWRVRWQPVGSSGCTEDWQASRGQLVVAFESGGDGMSTLSIYRAYPASVRWGTLFGGLVGALLGATLAWLLLLWRGSRVLAATVLTTAGVLPGAIIGGLSSVISEFWVPPKPFWTVWVSGVGVVDPPLLLSAAGLVWLVAATALPKKA
jgi:hypothetical protein